MLCQSLLGRLFKRPEAAVRTEACTSSPTAPVDTARSIQRANGISTSASRATLEPNACWTCVTLAQTVCRENTKSRKAHRPAAPAQQARSTLRASPHPFPIVRSVHREQSQQATNKRARLLASAATASTEHRPHVKPVPVAASVQRGPKRVDVLSTESTTPCGAASKVIGEFCREQERSSFLHALQVIGLSTAVVTIFKHVSSVPKANTSQTLWWESALYVQVQRHV